MGWAIVAGGNKTKEGILSAGRAIGHGTVRAGSAVKEGFRKIHLKFSGSGEKFSLLANRLKEKLETGDEKALELMKNLGINISFMGNRVTGSSVANSSISVTKVLENEGLLLNKSSSYYTETHGPENQKEKMHELSESEKSEDESEYVFHSVEDYEDTFHSAEEYVVSVQGTEKDDLQETHASSGTMPEVKTAQSSTTIATQRLAFIQLTSTTNKPKILITNSTAVVQPTTTTKPLTTNIKPASTTFTSELTSTAQAATTINVVPTTIAAEHTIATRTITRTPTPQWSTTNPKYVHPKPVSDNSLQLPTTHGTPISEEPFSDRLLEPTFPSGDSEPYEPPPFPDVFSNDEVRNRLKLLYENGDFSHSDLAEILNFDPENYEYYSNYYDY